MRPPPSLTLTATWGLLWAADGVNRPDGGRTAPSAINAQKIDLYVALPTGAYRYDAGAHALQLVAAADVRRVTGYQDFVDEAPLDLVFVADYSRMGMVPAAQRDGNRGADHIGPEDTAAGIASGCRHLFCGGGSGPARARQLPIDSSIPGRIGPP